MIKTLENKLLRRGMRYFLWVLLAYGVIVLLAFGFQNLAARNAAVAEFQRKLFPENIMFWQDGEL